MSKYKSGKRYADVLTVLLVIIIVAIIGLLGYFGYKAIDRKSVQANATSAADEFEKKLEEAKNDNKDDEEIEEPTETEEPTEGDTDLSGYLNNTQTPETSTDNNTTNTNSNKTYLDGYEIKGIIKISKTGIRYPILERVTVDSLNKSVAILDIAVCSEMTTSVKELNVPGTNVLILGHNYRNGMFFSDNDKLTVGDKITITDSAGSTVTYTIYDMYYTTANDIDFMKRELDPNTREITLQTCNEDSSQRLIIQAKDS